MNLICQVEEESTDVSDTESVCNFCLIIRTLVNVSVTTHLLKMQGPAYWKQLVCPHKEQS